MVALEKYFFDSETTLIKKRTLAQQLIIHIYIFTFLYIYLIMYENGINKIRNKYKQL